MKWCWKDLSGWTSFYAYLEKEARAANKVLTFESINTMLLGGAEKVQKCSSCNKSHPGKCNRLKTTAVVQNTEKTDKVCPVCGGSAHKYKMKSGSEGTSKRIKDSTSFKSASEQ